MGIDGETKVLWVSHIIELVNQYTIFPIRRVGDMEVDIDGGQNYRWFWNFQNHGWDGPYPTLLGINQAFSNNVIVKLKNRNMSFETKDLIGIVPFDLNEGEQFTKPTDNNAQSSILENISNITTHREDYLTSTIDGELTWRIIHSYDT